MDLKSFPAEPLNDGRADSRRSASHQCSCVVGEGHGHPEDVGWTLLATMDSSLRRNGFGAIRRTYVGFRHHVCLDSGNDTCARRFDFVPNGAGEFHRASGVAMNEDALSVRREALAAVCHDDALGEKAAHALKHFGLIVDDGAGDLAWYQQTIIVVGAIGQERDDGAEPGDFRGVLHRVAR